MKFIDDHILNTRIFTLPQGDVCKNFGRAAEDGGITIDGGVPGAEADLVRPELATQRQPLLIDQRLDGAGVDGAFALGERLEMQGSRNQRFSGAGGRVENHVLLAEQLEQRLFLGGVEGQSLLVHVFQEPGQQGVVVRVVSFGDEFLQCHVNAPCGRESLNVRPSPDGQGKRIRGAGECRSRNTECTRRRQGSAGQGVHNGFALVS